MRMLITAAALVLTYPVTPLAAQAPVTEEPIRLSLEEARDLALDRASDVRMAEARVSEADAAVSSARAAWLPSLDASASLRWRPTAESAGGSATYAPDPTAPLEERVRYLELAAPYAPFSVLDPQMLLSSREYGWVGGVEAEQIVFSGGRIGASVAAARAQEAAARAALAEAQARMSIEVAAAYREALLGREQVAAARAAWETAVFSLEQALCREAQDAGTELEILRAESDAAAIEPRVADAIEAERLANHRLRVLTGLPLDGPLLLTTPLEAPALDMEAEDLSDLLREAQQASIDGADASVEAAEAAVRSVRARARPSLVVQGGVQYDRTPDELFDLGGNWESSATLTVMVRLPLLVPGRGADERAARARLDQARIQAEQARESAFLEGAAVEAERARALTAWRSGQRRLTAARRAAELTAEALARGVATELELAQARLDVVEAEADAARAVSEYLSADAAGQGGAYLPQ